jgi:hypothetical protein
MTSIFLVPKLSKVEFDYEALLHNAEATVHFSLALKSLRNALHPHHVSPDLKVFRGQTEVQNRKQSVYSFKPPHSKCIEILPLSRQIYWQRWDSFWDSG